MQLHRLVQPVHRRGAGGTRGLVPPAQDGPGGLQAREEPRPPGPEVRPHHTGQVQGPAPQHRGTLREGGGQAGVQQAPG